MLQQNILGSADAALVAAVLAEPPPPPPTWHAAEGIDVAGEEGAVVTHTDSTLGRICAKFGECVSATSMDGAYAEFTWLGGQFTAVGLVRHKKLPGEESACSAISGQGAWRTPDAWMYFNSSGAICHAGDALPWLRGQMRGIAVGDTVGLLLRQGTLAVYLRSESFGSLVCAGVLCTGLVGEMLWAADLYDAGDSVWLRPKAVPRELTELHEAVGLMQLPPQHPVVMQPFPDTSGIFIDERADFVFC